jgi:hypothetical protein
MHFRRLTSECRRIVGHDLPKQKSPESGLTDSLEPCSACLALSRCLFFRDLSLFCTLKPPQSVRGFSNRVPVRTAQISRSHASGWCTEQQPDQAARILVAHLDQNLRKACPCKACTLDKKTVRGGA